MPALLLVAALGCGDTSRDVADGSGGVGGSGGTGGAGGTGGVGGGGAGGAGGNGGEVVSLPGLEIVDLVTGVPVDLTPDGSTALIEDLATGDLYFHDTVENQLELKTDVGDPLRALATAISSGGRIVALHGEPVQPGIWDEASGWVDLGSPFPQGCDEKLGSAFDVSADGSVVVGLLWNGCDTEAFRWTDAAGTGVFSPLEVLGAGFDGSSAAPINRATVISDDGKVAAGFAQNGRVDRSPAIWNEDGTGFLLDPADDQAPGEVLSISADGGTVAGIWGGDGFVWTRDGGKVLLGRLETAMPGAKVFANAISGDGQLVFGGCGDEWSGTPEAFVWTAAEGMRPLQALAVENGIEIPEGVVLTNVLAVSADGSVVAGLCFDADGVRRPFVLRLPTSAYGIAE